MTLDDLRDLVTRSGGLATVAARDLRDLRGSGRLGRHVRNDISRHLAAAGLSLWAQRVPNDQRQVVTVYDRESVAGRLIDLAREVADSEATER